MWISSLGGMCQRRRLPLVTKATAKYRRLWKWAYTVIKDLLLLRRRWADIGHLLDNENLKNLTKHLERKQGKLVYKKQK